MVSSFEAHVLPTFYWNRYTFTSKGRTRRIKNPILISFNSELYSPTGNWSINALRKCECRHVAGYQEHATYLVCSRVSNKTSPLRFNTTSEWLGQLEQPLDDVKPTALLISLIHCFLVSDPVPKDKGWPAVFDYIKANLRSENCVKEAFGYLEELSQSITQSVSRTVTQSAVHSVSGSLSQWITRPLKD